MENNLVIRSAAISDRGLSEKRSQNEDSFLEIGQKGIFAVADGVGGANAGEVASQMAVEILGEAFTNFAPGSDAEHVMKSALEQANSAIHQMSNDLSQLSQMATTVVALHVAGNIATIGHVGDSRLYRLDPAGTLYRETDDHSMVGEEVRAGRMTEEQAENHPSKNIISRALGAEPNVQVDLKTMMVEPDTKFLLCSDGVTRHIGDIELAELIASHEDASVICQQIKAICFQRGAEDNLTAVIVEVTGNPSSAVALSPLAESDDVLSLPDDDEMTVATARFPKSAADESSTDEDDFLELETQQLVRPAAARYFEPEGERLTADSPAAEISDDADLHDTIPFTATDTAEVEMPLVPPREDHLDLAPIQAAVHEPVPVEMDPVYENPVYSEPPPALAKEDNFAMFGHDTTGTVADRAEPRSSSVLGKLAGYLGMLIIGSLIGAGAYYTFVRPAPVADAPPITEMRSANVQLSSFEELRREVDKDPASFLTRDPNPQDAEDFYLRGRAFFLTYDFVKARESYAAAKNLIGKGDETTKGDPKNAQVILSDIAVSMAVMNDPFAQKNLKAELDALKTATPR